MMAMDVKKAYLAEVKTALPAVGSNELLFAGVSDSVDAYLADNPSAGVTELYQAIGTPAEVAQAALDEAAPGDIQKKLAKKKRWAVVAAGIILLLVLIGSGVAYIVNSLHEIEDGTFIEKIIEEGSQVEIPSNQNEHH